MRVMGVDPGLTRCGYAVIEQKGTSQRALVIDVLTTPKDSPDHERLAELHKEIARLIEEFSPQAIAIEKIFIKQNRTTGTAVSQAAGLAMALGSLAGCEISEYTPKQVKAAITNWGGADKQQVGDMVKLLLNLPEAPKFADSADAAAVALCHLAQAPKILKSQMESVESNILGK